MIDSPARHLWYHRLSQVTVATALIVVAFYLLSAFTGDAVRLSAALQVGMLPAVFAFAALLAAILPRRLAPKRFPAALPLLTQTLLWLSVTILLFQTGGVYSPFLALWIPATIFAAMFGTHYLAPILLVPTAYIVWLFLEDELSLPIAIPVLLIGTLPPILSSLIFTHSTADKEDSTYKQLANEFSEVSGKAEAVIGAITNGVIALNNQGVIELINPAAQHLIGWDRRDALKLSYRSVLKLTDETGNELAPGSDPIAQALANNEEVRTEDLSLITNSGKKLLISLVVSPVGQPGSGIIVVFRDITKEKTEEREQAEFISTASHEMRTPVASIEGYLGLALNPATAQIDEKAREYITKAQEVAQHLGRLFQDLLDITRAEDGRLPNNPRAVEVVSFVQDIVQGLRPNAEAKGLIMVYKPVPDEKTNDKPDRRLNPVYYINVDNDHFREVISNLVENAIKYTAQGTISIDVTGNEKFVTINVQDTGIGIPTEDLPHLFQKFYRVDNSDTREIGGTGLGLYLCRQLTESMGGRIWAESQFRQGSTFHVELPRISHQEAMQLIETSDEEEEPVTVPAEAPADASMEPAQTLQAQQSNPPVPQSVPQTIPPHSPASQTSADGVFASPPADLVAAQLATQAQPQPQQPQQPQTPQPPPTQPVDPIALDGPQAPLHGAVNYPASTQQPQPQAYPQPQPQVQPQAPTHHAQTPEGHTTLAAIEQNPKQYLQQYNDPSNPPENQNQP